MKIHMFMRLPGGKTCVHRIAYKRGFLGDKHFLCGEPATDLVFTQNDYGSLDAAVGYICERHLAVMRQSNHHAAIVLDADGA